VILLVGLVAMVALPIARYPDIAPPTVKISAVYPGADARTISETVAAPIEQEVNGVENMLYMNSVSSDDGAYSLTVTFEIGTDMDMATVLVQNRVAIAQPKLPEDVRRQGIVTKKQSTSVIQYLTLTSTKPEHDALFLSNFATLRLKDALARIPGVGAITIFGSDEYSMRIWLDPALLKARRLTTQDVLNAIAEQNVQVAAGRIGEPPAPDGTAFQFTVNTQGRLRTPEQFGDLIVRAEGIKPVRVKDIARVETGAKSYNVASTFDGQPTATIAVYQLPGANALTVADSVRATMDELSEGFDEGIEYHIPFDTTRFVEASITEVYKTLFVAVLLVVAVIYIFLQDWRATIIPCAAIPVSLIGTFAVMAMLGFSINMLTLFGIVLAIGIVVDDAIVVVENTATHLDTGLSAKAAAEKAMDEITGPVIATTLVLLAVFIPTAFMGGITGQLYRQFALTISAAVVISSINALTLSPALCGMLLRKADGPRGRFFGAFNRVFDASTGAYSGGAKRLVRSVPVVLIVYAALVALAGWSLSRLPTGFIPTEDQGYALVNIQLPDSASLERTEEVMRRLDKIIGEQPGVANWVSITGYSILSGARASNAGLVAVVFDPWEERTSADLQQEAILGRLQRQFSQVQEAIIFCFIPPAIDGLGAAGGFQMQVEDRRDAGLSELGEATMELISTAQGQAGIVGLNTTFRASSPQLFADIDRTKVKTLGVPLTSVFSTLQAYLGSAYVNDFNALGRTYQVRLQADSQYRVSPNDIRQLDVRNAAGEMIPLGTFVDVKEIVGPQVLQRFNLFPTAQINGSPAPGFSSGQAMRLMEKAAESLPEGMGFEWAGMSYQEEKLMKPDSIVKSQGFILALSIVLVFLVLAFQYESWTSPAAVIAVVPLAALGVVAVLMVRGADNNVYTQIGLVLLVALASKNAILIVEFAAEQRRRGVELRQAAVEAARLRFRAILMTAFSSILGFLPLLISSGAGAASRQAVGNAVVGGMAAATVFSLMLTPVFFVVFRGLGERTRPAAKTPA
ncbi:MAG: efflux RND transporter permease subunit, partial [Planctomycetales bacterium]|nr:efflux RND transporter permease subunit [Planctomycetales bacterium]